MEEKITLSSKFRLSAGILVLVGVAALAYGFLTDPGQTWANYLLNNFYFLSLAIGAAFFLALQAITQAGWSAAFKRVPEAMSQYIPFSAVFFLLLILGYHSLYEWSHEGIAEQDALIAHKTPFLNIPFFYIRTIVYFAAWVLMIWLMRKTSLKEDALGGMEPFRKFEFYSKVFIFVLALTFSLAAFDWIMSIDVHWFSTVFAVKNFIAAFYHGSSIVVLVVLVLHGRGYFKFLNDSHLHDFARYIFMLAIVWGYLYFAQFMLIWYANIPEETYYYVPRLQTEPWRTLFFLNIILNWAIPFLVLMPRRTSRSKPVILGVIGLLIIGQWVDLYLQIFPGTTATFRLGLVEIGTFLGYAGLFALVTGYALTRASLIPKNHPYLEESLHHEF